LHVTNATTTHLYPPWDPRVLSSLNALINVFGPMYPVNSQSVGIGIGRYPEDVYNGVSDSEGNPWLALSCQSKRRFLCTSAAAETIYLTALDAVNNQSVETTSLSVPFYQRFLPSISVGTYPANSSEFTTILDGMITFGDSFLSTVQQHAFENGSISEEFDRSSFPFRVLIVRNDGYCVGARDLTWSYVAFQTASDARQRLASAVNASGLQDNTKARSRHGSHFVDQLCPPPSRW
jgi:glucoamylase